MFESTWMTAGVVMLAILLFPFVVVLTAKLWAYGTAAGRRNFERGEQKRRDQRGKGS